MGKVGGKRPGRPPGIGVAGATRERILEAAADVFGEKGYYGAAVDDIVRASDTSKGSFYFHFPNKQGIFTALLEHLTARLTARVEGAVQAAPETPWPAWTRRCRRRWGRSGSAGGWPACCWWRRPGWATRWTTACWWCTSDSPR